MLFRLRFRRRDCLNVTITREKRENFLCQIYEDEFNEERLIECLTWRVKKVLIKLLWWYEKKTLCLFVWNGIWDRERVSKGVIRDNSIFVASKFRWGSKKLIDRDVWGIEFLLFSEWIEKMHRFEIAFNDEAEVHLIYSNQ